MSYIYTHIISTCRLLSVSSSKKYKIITNESLFSWLFPHASTTRKMDLLLVRYNLNFRLDIKLDFRLDIRLYLLKLCGLYILYINNGRRKGPERSPFINVFALLGFDQNDYIT